MKKEYVLSVVGLCVTMAINIAAIGYNNGRISQQLDMLIEDTKDFDKDLKELQEFSKVTIGNQIKLESLKAYSISHGQRLDSLGGIVESVSSNQKVMDKVLSDLTAAINELTENTRTLTNVVKDVAVMEQRVKVLENGK